MKFGPIRIDDAVGAILAHGQRAGGRVLKKGQVLSPDDTDALMAAGQTTVIVAQIEPGDVHEDEAARRLAQAAAGTGLSVEPPFTGRCNVVADHDGLLLVDRNALDRINAIDEGLTAATLKPFAEVAAGQMVATIKVIPFAVPDDLLEQAVAEVDATTPTLRVLPYRVMRAGLVQTTLPGTKDSVLDKTSGVMKARLARYGCELAMERRLVHGTEAVANVLKELHADGCDLLMVAGASAIVDRRDVVPAAIEYAGGTVDHLGMPVDPGNLLLLGRLGDVPVIGLPGCARSPKYNGLDMVLARLAAGLTLASVDIMAMGTGGLLKEMADRPQPRTGTVEKAAARASKVAAVVLAAGQSRRMGARNKLLAEIDGTPMIVRVVDAVMASRVESVFVVTGHEADAVRDALRDRGATIVACADYAAGLSASLKAGLAALPRDIDAALVCLGDMPRLTAGDIDTLIAAFDPIEGRAICVPTYRGKRGNPVLWDRRFFLEMMALEGDVGARHLIGQHADVVAEVPMETDGVLVDIDSPDALAMLAKA